jgi:hypothetical protein
MVTFERARDGDYGLQDVAALRANPFHAQRNLEGFTHRDIIAPTFQLTHSGSRVDFSVDDRLRQLERPRTSPISTTPRPRWVTRSNTEDDFQFTEELRFLVRGGGADRAGRRRSR